MSQEYYIYLEAKIYDKWQLVNNTVKVLKSPTDEELIATTYWSGSRSYFSNTYEKLYDIGYRISYEGLSNGLKKRFEFLKEKENDEYDYYNLFAVKYSTFKSFVPRDDQKERHGIIHKDIIEQYENGDIEELYQGIELEEYSKLSPDAQKCYQYYEWDDSMGWYENFREIDQHINWQWYEFNDVNYMSDTPEMRLIVYTV